MRHLLCKLSLHDWYHYTLPLTAAEEATLNDGWPVPSRYSERCYCLRRCGAETTRRVKSGRRDRRIGAATAAARAGGIR